MAVLIVKDYRLVTAEILYHLPDYPKILQSYVWQDHDLTPRLPNLRRFLDFWNRNLDGKLHSIRVDTGESVRVANVRATSWLNVLN